MRKEPIESHGWANTMLLAGDHMELVSTLDVGPRIIACRTPGGENVFKTFDNQLGGSGEGDWMIRGGHRLWIAPEHRTRTYHLDNHPPTLVPDTPEDTVVAESLQTDGGNILKTLTISLDPERPRATVRHTAKNVDSRPLEFATWGLSVMRPGGLAIIPQPPLGEHPRDLLPNRSMVLWPYTDLSDPRLHFGRSFITLRQQDDLPPTKLGLALHTGWTAYVVDDSIFIKTVEILEDASYPDGGCNFEAFTNTEMLELETLGPLATLEPGEETGHVEHWSVQNLEEEILIDSEEALHEWIAPFLARAGFAP
jgi:hypothetical protein